MSWWKNLWSRPASPAVPEALRGLRFSLSGWNEKEPKDNMRIWSGPDGSVMVADFSPERWDKRSEAEARQQARALAESAGGGLVEALSLSSPAGTAVQLIYKRLPKPPGYVYTGMFIVPAEGGSVTWSVVAGECRMTGIRESVVTAELMNAGKLSLENYERTWAQDPYDRSYRSVDRSVLRFLSDDERFDRQFPDHPLTKIRLVLGEIARQAQAVRQAGVSAAA